VWHTACIHSQDDVFYAYDRSGPERNTEHGLAGLRRIRNGSRKGHTRPQHVFFKGEATAVEKEASFSFAEIKQQLRAGQGLQMLPVLLAIGGFLGLFLFGSVIAFARA
jgi:hypothetical protein